MSWTLCAVLLALTHDLSEVRRIDEVTITFLLYKTNRFYVAVRLFKIAIVQIASKCVKKNIYIPHVSIKWLFHTLLRRKTAF